MIEWFVTAPNPRVVTQNADAGQRGWRVHAVDIPGPKSTLHDIRNNRSLCGLLPRHGWTMDLFIERQCERCAQQMRRMGVK